VQNSSSGEELSDKTELESHHAPSTTHRDEGLAVQDSPASEQVPAGKRYEDLTDAFDEHDYLRIIQDPEYENEAKVGCRAHVANIIVVNL